MSRDIRSEQLLDIPQIQAILQGVGPEVLAFVVDLVLVPLLLTVCQIRIICDPLPILRVLEKLCGVLGFLDVRHGCRQIVCGRFLVVRIRKLTGTLFQEGQIQAFVCRIKPKLLGLLVGHLLRDRTACILLLQIGERLSRDERSVGVLLELRPINLIRVAPELDRCLFLQHLQIETIEYGLPAEFCGLLLCPSGIALLILLFQVSKLVCVLGKCFEAAVIRVSESHQNHLDINTARPFESGCGLAYH
ncbi:hypothetical protein D3C76_1195330 [compost metagenome]